MGLGSKIFGTHSDKELKRIYPIVDKIEALDEDMQKLSDDELKAKTDEFKKRLKDGETLDDILVEAFAVVREAAKLVGGGGGGRPNMAQAGGKNPAGIKDALDKAVEVLKNQIK